MKKLLLLGGADIQISAIEKGIELGYHVITCDYLPDNPGHKISHEYFNVSTTDREAVLDLASSLNIDGISAYASDPAAITAAFVSDALNLPGNPLESVLQLSNKCEFRRSQHEIGVPTPEFRSIETVDDVLDMAAEFDHGIIVKPADTSGSKGVFRVDPKSKLNLDRVFIQAMLEEGMDYSRMKILMAEEYISRVGFLMSGDVLIDAGQIKFMSFGDVHFNERINGIVPRSISLPASKPADFFKRVQDDLQKIIERFNLQSGVINVDVIETSTGKPVMIDIGIRNGGNLFNDIIYYHSGVNLIELSLRQCVGDPVGSETVQTKNEYYAHTVIHSEHDGIFDSVEFSNDIKPLIIYRAIKNKKGDQVRRFTNSSHRIGLILLKFNSFEQMHHILGNFQKHISVVTT